MLDAGCLLWQREMQESVPVSGHSMSGMDVMVMVIVMLWDSIDVAYCRARTGIRGSQHCSDAEASRDVFHD